MKNFPLLAALALSALVLVAACEDDPVQPAAESRGKIQYMSLTTREAVLNNIEYAYDNRNINTYDELFDLDFIFFFSPGDVDGGLPVQWSRTDELGATNDLFISNDQPVPEGPACISIRMDLTLENLEWDEISPEDYPGETWYTTTINYDFTFKMLPDETYNSENGARGQFAVRNVGTEKAPQWRLIEWRDLGNDSLAIPKGPVSTSVKFDLVATRTRAVGDVTWGAIKALYN